MNHLETTSFKKLMQASFNMGWYGGKQELLKVSMMGAFEGWSGHATETWEQRFYVTYRVPQGENPKDYPEEVYEANADTLEVACADILRQLTKQPF